MPYLQVFPFSVLILTFFICPTDLSSDLVFKKINAKFTTINRSAMATQILRSLGSSMRKCLFSVLSVGAIPNHIAFIMDGNQRSSMKENMLAGAGFETRFLALISMLKYCYELGVKYVTIYAFSIYNFRMDLMLEKIEASLKKENIKNIMNQYGVRICFIGNLKLLSEPVRVAAEKAMMATANNTRIVLLICVAYTSFDENVYAVQESCKLKGSRAGRTEIEGVEGQEKEERPVLKVEDVDQHTYMALAPNPDILIQSSGKTHLSNFLLWQTANCLLYSPAAAWLEIGLWHLVWAVLNFQRNHSYLEEKKKQSIN